MTAPKKKAPPAQHTDAALPAEAQAEVEAMLSGLLKGNVVRNAPGTASADQHCGLVAIVGKPNVGKSTLLNALVGQKISITSRKAQNTRHRITGMLTRGANQFVFVDTPGFQTLQHHFPSTSHQGRPSQQGKLSSLT